MTGAKRRILDSHGLVSEAGANVVRDLRRVGADNHEHARTTEFQRRIDGVIEHGPSAHGVQHLGPWRFHALALASGEDYRRSRARDRLGHWRLLTCHRPAFSGKGAGFRPELRVTDFVGATIVFDLDGTLVDTAPDLAASLNAVLTADDVTPVTLATARAMIGGGVRALVLRAYAAAGIELSPADASQRIERFIEDYRSHIAHNSRPYPGLVEALQWLSSQGARLAVCTNKRSNLSCALLQALGLADYFAAIIGADLAPAAKPDPRHLTLAVERAGGRMDRAVMVGDSRLDALLARAAALPLILVDFGYADAPAQTLGPDVLISHFDELPDACARLLGLSRPCPAARPCLSSLP
jgi:phosphoglycolate phosphatase